MAKKLFAFVLSLSSALFSISSKTAKSLEIDQSSLLFQDLDRTQTIFGQESLEAILDQFSYDTALLRSRQSAVSAILKDEAVLNSLDSQMLKISKLDAGVLNFINTIADNSKFLDEFYYKNRHLKKYNTSPLFLELGQFAHLSNLMSSVAQHAASALIINWLLKSDEPCCSAHAHEHKHKHGHKHSHKHSHAHKKEISPATKNIIKGIQLWHVGSHFQELYGVYSVTSDKFSKIKHVYLELISLSLYLNSIYKIYELTRNNPGLMAAVDNFELIENVALNKNLNSNFEQLLKVLTSSSFIKKPSKFYRVGNILAAYNLVNICKDELLNLFKTVGQIDAYLSISKLVKNQEFCFAKYIDSASPFVSIDGFRHPLVKSEISLNSATLGKYFRNMLLTGPNAGGKSTALKSISLSIYLAQTIGVVPALSCELTPFKKIFVIITPSDDISRGKSLFVSEFENSQDILNELSLLGSNEYAYLAFDELFKSTNYKKGFETAEEFLKAFSSNKNVLSVTTTHFNELSRLEKVSPLAFKNWTLKNYSLVQGVGF